MGENLWDHSAVEVDVGTRLERDLSVDLAVIGGGFTGCAAALEAAQSGASVAVFEARGIGHGGSGRNVGLVNAGLWLSPDAVASRMDVGAAERLNNVLAGAPDAVFDLIGAHGIDCEAVRAGTLYCAHEAGAVAKLEDRARQGNRLGAPLEVWDSARVAAATGASGLHGALFDPRAGTIQPLAYVRGLARAAVAAGAQIFTHAPVTRMARDGDWRLEIGGHVVRARRVLVATNAYHDGVRGVARPRFVSVGYSQFATDPLPDALRSCVLPGGQGCWDTAMVMSSFRIDAQGRLILGGLGDRAAAGGALHDGWARRKLAALYPDVRDIPFRHSWSGRIAMTRDHVPKVLRLGPGALSCFGYSGRGIGPGTVFGTLAARALLSGDDSHLPVAPVGTHAEPFGRLRRAVYEMGAQAVHAVAARVR